MKIESCVLKNIPFLRPGLNKLTPIDNIELGIFNTNTSV